MSVSWCTTAGFTPTTVPAGRVMSQIVAPVEGTTRSRGMETPGWRRIASRIAACLSGVSDDDR